MKKAHPPRPDWIPLNELKGRIAQLTGVCVSDYTIRKWLRTRQLLYIIWSGDRRKKFVPERELERFIQECSDSGEKLAEELEIYEE